MPGKFKNGKTCVLLEDMQILEDGGHRASGAESRLRFFACWYLVLRSQRSRALWQSFEPWTRSADSIAEVACINAGRVKLELGKRIESPSRMLIRSKKECQMVPFAIFCCRRSVVNSFDMAELFFLTAQLSVDALKSSAWRSIRDSAVRFGFTSPTKKPPLNLFQE